MKSNIADLIAKGSQISRALTEERQKREQDVRLLREAQERERLHQEAERAETARQAAARALALREGRVRRCIERSLLTRGIPCGEKFTITPDEAAFFASRSMDLPKRCHACRRDRKAARS